MRSPPNEVSVGSFPSKNADGINGPMGIKLNLSTALNASGSKASKVLTSTVGLVSLSSSRNCSSNNGKVKDKALGLPTNKNVGMSQGDSNNGKPGSSMEHDVDGSSLLLSLLARVYLFFHLD